MPGQEKLTLRADIKYKSNWQQGTLKAQRRNKWICALKSSMAKLNIFGPGGDPGGHPGPAKYTLVPWEEVKRKEDEEEHHRHATSHSPELQIPKGDWTFADQNSAIGASPRLACGGMCADAVRVHAPTVDNAQDVFDEGSQLYMPRPQQTPGATPRMRNATMPSMPTAVSMPAPAPGMPTASAPPLMEEIELNTPRADQLYHNV